MKYKNPKLNCYYEFVLCSISRLFVYLRMRMSTSNLYCRSSFEPGYLRVSPVLRLHLCAFWLYLARYLCGFQTKKNRLSSVQGCEPSRQLVEWWNIDWQVRGMCRCLWYTRGLCLCPCVITPRGFTSLQTQKAECSFSGCIPTNKQINKQIGALTVWQ